MEDTSEIDTNDRNKISRSSCGPIKSGPWTFSYIPMASSLAYLAAIIDWFRRSMLSCKLSITMNVSFCLEAQEEALEQYGRPEIFNTDQGSQFTSVAFTNRFKLAGIAITMDGKVRWADNVFVERFWRSLQYKHLHQHAWESVYAARSDIRNYIELFNQQRLHSSLNRRTPDQVYFNRLLETMVS